MFKRRHKIGANRHQGTRLPVTLDEYISENHTVRAIEVYVNTLDLAELGFDNMETNNERGDGQPTYPPEALLKLYRYGYMNRLRSSRRLEREARVNLELIWLLQKFQPSHATIANFRKNNLKALKAVNRDFVKLCREMNLYGGERVAIDGTFMEGNASEASVSQYQQLEESHRQLEADIDDYRKPLEHNDTRESDLPALEDKHLKEKLQALEQRQAECHGRLRHLEKHTDIEARLLNKRGKKITGYHVQIAVDEKHKRVVHNEVVQDANDTQQLEEMAVATKEVLKVKELKVIAAKGYENHAHIKAGIDADITPYVPLVDREAQARQAGRFVRSDFKYDEHHDSYQCPAGQNLTRQGQQKKGDKINFKYAAKASVCSQCPLREQCLPAKTPYRQLYRWEHEAVIDAHRERMPAAGHESMRIRAQLAEHPFGTMKSDMGWQHFLMRGLEKVRTEMNMQMWAYNFKRVLNIMGVIAFKNGLNQRITG